MAIEFTRLALVYLHLIACCVAIGLVLLNDIDVAKQLIIAKADQQLEKTHIENLRTTVFYALAALWITGAMLVALDIYQADWNVLKNPKLQAKIIVVTLLTVNGFVLHHHVLPLLIAAGSLLRLCTTRLVAAVFTGALSFVSWFYAAFLGIARPLNWKYTIVEILSAYPFLIVGGFTAMMCLTSWSQRKTSGQRRTVKRTMFAAKK
jgi:hypothetical protein